MKQIKKFLIGQKASPLDYEITIRLSTPLPPIDHDTTITIRLYHHNLMTKDSWNMKRSPKIGGGDTTVRLRH